MGCTRVYERSDAPPLNILRKYLGIRFLPIAENNCERDHSFKHVQYAQRGYMMCTLTYTGRGGGGKQVLSYMYCTCKISLSDV